VPRDDAQTFVTTRLAIHAVAEYVLAPARHASDGHIGLRVELDGLGPPRLRGGRQLLVVGTDIVVRDGADERRAPLTTLRDAATFVGIEPGAPADVYTPAMALDPDAPLAVDADAARALHAWFVVVDRALARLGVLTADDPSVPVEPTLWPEHFDLALADGEVNLGGSPGDEAVDEPYLYVGPWARPLPEAGLMFWNADFGAVLRQRDVRSLDDAVDFLRRGRSLAR
jgi:hypothetical protein